VKAWVSQAWQASVLLHYVSGLDSGFMFKKETKIIGPKQTKDFFKGEKNFLISKKREEFSLKNIFP
jgi:hypothetical protein